MLLPTMSLMVVGAMGSAPVLGAYSAELFPTALRGQAGSWAALARVSGQATSLAAGAALLRATGSLPLTTTILGAGSLLAIGLYAIRFPDTHGQELEQLTGEGISEATPIAIAAMPAALR